MKKPCFNFTSPPINLYFVTPKEKKSKKFHKAKMILYIFILSLNEKYICQLDLKKFIFKNVSNIISKKNPNKFFFNQDTKFKLYNNKKILCYDPSFAYVISLFGGKKLKNLKQSNIESVTLLNSNLFSICTPNKVFIYDTSNETILGDFDTHSLNKKCKLIKPENNLLLVYSSRDVSLYDLESLMIFQKLNLGNIIQYEQIQKAKQLNNNNIAILFNTKFAIYNLQKDCVTFVLSYWNYQNYKNSILMEISPNNILVNNDGFNFYIFNSIKGNVIAKMNINNDEFIKCKKIKKYIFKYDESQDKSIEKDNDQINHNYILTNTYNSNFIISSLIE